MPDTCVVKRQQYRHVDYCQIMNSQELRNFLQPWITSQRSVQRVGFLYGYYAEDPNYKGGVRAVLEAMYGYYLDMSLRRRETLLVVSCCRTLSILT
jgi:nuclear protein localization family protein 4